MTKTPQEIVEFCKQSIENILSEKPLKDEQKEYIRGISNYRVHQAFNSVINYINGFTNIEQKGENEQK